MVVNERQKCTKKRDVILSIQPIAFLIIIIGNLSKDVFERRTSTGSEAFFLFICLDAIKFSLLSFFSLLKTIYSRVLTKPPPNDTKGPLLVDVRRPKTLNAPYNENNKNKNKNKNRENKITIPI